MCLLAELAAWMGVGWLLMIAACCSLLYVLRSSSRPGLIVNKFEIAAPVAKPNAKMSVQTVASPSNLQPASSC